VSSFILKIRPWTYYNYYYKFFLKKDIQILPAVRSGFLLEDILK
jgi:hypothetical protein